MLTAKTCYYCARRTRIVQQYFFVVLNILRGNMSVRNFNKAF